MQRNLMRAVAIGAALMTLAATALADVKDYEFQHLQGKTMIVREPIGVCGFITPWNWPINQIMCKVAPALAAGCTMVLKPSEIAPLNAILFAEVLAAAGVPKGVFNLVNGDGPTVGQAIASHPGVDLVSFTGSTRAGILVAKAAADTVKRVHQELGRMREELARSLRVGELRTAYLRAKSAIPGIEVPSRLRLLKAKLSVVQASYLRETRSDLHTFWDRLRGRLRHVHSFQPDARSKLTESPEDSLRRFFFDTVVHDAGLLKILVETVGADRVVLGSDHPFDMGDLTPAATVQAAGLDPGGDIYIHGLPRGLSVIGADHARIDWTNGCIAVTDEELEEIWARVPDGTPIEILP